MNTADRIKDDVEVVAKYIMTPDSVKHVGDQSEVRHALLRLLSGFLINVHRIAVAQERVADLLQADATPQTLVKVEEQRG